MGLIVERGEALANATAFAFAEEYKGFIDLNFFPKADCEPNDLDIERALSTAARMLSDRISWKGCKLRRSQMLAFPRANLIDCDGHCIPCCEIPREIIEANIILAHQLLKGEISPFTNESDAKVKSLTMSEYSVTFAGAGTAIRQTDGCGGTMTMSADKFGAVRHLFKCYSKGALRGLKIRRS